MAEHFSGMPELLVVLSEQIHNRKQLYNLCLVNHAFRVAFSRQLYKCLRLDGKGLAFLLDQNKRRLLVQNKDLAYTRVLIVLRSGMKDCISNHLKNYTPKNYFNRFVFLSIEHIYNQVNDAIIDILRHTRRLQSFAMVIYSCQNIALSSECMRILTETPHLRSLSIEFSNTSEQFLNTTQPGGLGSTITDTPRMTRYGHLEIHLPNFLSLQRLSLLQLSGNIKGWRNQVLKTLLASPNLEYISLSISKDTVERLQNDGNEEEGNDFYLYSFERLCEKYAEQANNLLNLKSIRLGYGFQFPEISILSKATNLRALEEVYIYYKHADPQTYTIPRDLLCSEVTPNLQVISLYQMNNGTLEIIQDMMNPETSRVGLQMARVDLKAHNVDARLTAVHNLFGKISNARVPMVMLPQTGPWELSLTETLSQIQDCSWITTLAFGFPSHQDNEEEAMSTFASRICKVICTLTSLTALWVFSWYGWRGVIPGSVAIAHTTAKNVAQACRSLRYIRIGSWAWRIHRGNTSYSSNTCKDAVEFSTHLEALDQWEDVVEGPRFFHVPNPLPWSEKLEHVDWYDINY